MHCDEAALCCLLRPAATETDHLHEKRDLPIAGSREILSFPVEILERILQIYVDGEIYLQVDTNNYFNLARVCRRFRAVMNDNPLLRIWREIHTLYSSRWRAIQLERSRNCSLTIRNRAVKPGGAEYVDRLKVFWEQMRGHCHRIERVIIQTTRVGASSGPNNVVEAEFVVPSDLDLPMLTTLNIFDHFNHPTPISSSPHPCRSWKMPNLKELTGDTTTFALTLPTCLSFLSVTMDITDPMAVSSLLSLLGTEVGSNLTELSLGFRKPAGDGSSEEPVGNVLGPVTLSNLERIEIYSPDYEPTTVDIYRVFAPHMRMPNIKTVSVRLLAPPTLNERTALRYWLSHDDFASLESLVVDVILQMPSSDPDLLGLRCEAKLKACLDQIWEEKRRPEIGVKCEFISFSGFNTVINIEDYENESDRETALDSGDEVELE